MLFCSCLFRLSAGICPAEREDEFGSDTLCAYDVNVFIMSLDGFFNDCKTESGSFFVFAAGEIGFVEALPDLIQFFAGDSEAGVFDGYEDLFASACDFYCYRGFILTEFNGVVHQVVKHLLDFTSVRVYKLYIRKQEKFDGYPLVRACAFK